MINEGIFSVFTLPRMLFFLAGLAIATMFHLWYCRRQKTSINLNPLGMIAGISVIVFIAVQQVNLAAEVQDCQVQFNTALNARAEYNDDSDDLARQEREALVDWLRLLTNPPPRIADLHTTDPLYHEWAQQITKHYFDRLSETEERRKEADFKRRQHPLPEPTCGRN